MKSLAIHERVDRVLAVRADGAAELADVQAALGGVRQLRSWLAAAEADLAGRVAEAVSFPEATLAEASRGSVRAAANTLERSATLKPTPHLAAALDRADITPGHVDAVTRVVRTMEPEQRDELFERVDAMADIAARATVADFGRRVRDEARRIAQDDGEARLDRQRRATSMSSWVGHDGMWNVRGQFDPVTGLGLDSALSTVVEKLFSESTPETCPTDPIEKQKHLRARAFAALIEGGGPGASARPEFVTVIDIDAADGADASMGCGDSVRVTWPIPVEVPGRVLAELLGTGNVHTVVVRNGIVLHAPGTLNLGRSTRLANRAQRRALRGLYSTCAIPGCDVHFDRCKLHHIAWWRHGGATDLHNLLPVCATHHAKIHHGGWVVTLGPNREIEIRFPDGSVRNTGPPTRRAA